MRGLFASRNAKTATLAVRLARVAGSELPVLLEGETGSGKSFVAERLHRRSRRGGPFVVVDCGALPTTLVAAELFGHAGGAFTDAGGPRSGWCERAGSGTLLLDRVDTLAREGQQALLRVLESRSFMPLGAASPRPFKARVVATVEDGVLERLNEGQVGADLFHRLAGLHARMPPLRERAEDILPLAERFLAQLAQGEERRLVLAPEARDLLQAYPWPGNVRELKIVLERAVLMVAGEEITAPDLLLSGTGWDGLALWCGEERRSLRDVSRLYALWVLAAEAGNVSRAARVLGISRRTLIRWRDRVRE